MTSPIPPNSSPSCIAPWCFDSHEQFTEWYQLAVRSREAASVCDDCTPEFKARMKRERRCDDYKWQVLEFTSRSRAPRKEAANG
jgi:hypothetical protein